MPRGFDPDSYISINDRLARFQAEHADGQVRTGYEILGDGRSVIFWASVSAGVRRGGGHALRMLGEDRALEKAETAAIGRALVAFGYEAKKVAAPRAGTELASGAPNEARAATIYTSSVPCGYCGAVSFTAGSGRMETCTGCQKKRAREGTTTE